VLCGPSGSGKTTLLNMMGCIDRPDTGEIQVDGQAAGAGHDGRCAVGLSRAAHRVRVPELQPAAGVDCL
jgi:ABC-type polar amino acid transport system ATPase subunit